MRATYQKQNGEVIFPPYIIKFSGNRILEQIAAQMLTKKITNVGDIRDESDHENLPHGLLFLFALIEWY